MTLCDRGLGISGFGVGRTEFIFKRAPFGIPSTFSSKFHYWNLSAPLDEKKCSVWDYCCDRKPRMATFTVLPWTGYNVSQPTEGKDGGGV